MKCFRHSIKTFILHIPIIGGQIKKLRISPQMKQQPGYWLGKVVEKKHAQAVQIGSNDGDRGDPLHKLLGERKGWKGLFVEPVPYLFERLKCSYGGSGGRYRFANVAVNDGSNGTFYCVDASAADAIPDLPEWYDQLGSFDRDHIMNHLDGVLEPFIRELPVRGVSMAQLFEQEDITELDILHIDTEGYDWKILSQLDLARYQPSVILYEHLHLAPGEREESIGFVSGEYALFEFPSDILAIRKPLAARVLPEMAKFGIKAL